MFNVFLKNLKNIETLRFSICWPISQFHLKNTSVQFTSIKHDLMEINRITLKVNCLGDELICHLGSCYSILWKMGYRSSKPFLSFG